MEVPLLRLHTHPPPQTRKERKEPAALCVPLFLSTINGEEH